MGVIIVATRVVFPILVLLGSAVPLSAQPPGPRTIIKEPVPAWVEIYAFDLHRPSPRKDVGGTWFLVSDWQHDSRSRTTYRHVAFRFMTESGVQDESQFTADYDPAYERLRFHKLIVHRDGKALDRLAAQKLKVIERETDHERQLYDGRLSVLAVIEDVRVGDTLEYAYSVEGANPVLDGRYAKTLSTTWSSSVAHLRLRLLWHGDRAVRITTANTALEPTATERDGFMEYAWAADDVPAKLSDGDLPSSYDPWGRIRLADWKSWGEVVQWALKQYPIPKKLPAVLETEANRIAALATPEERIVAALRFVQDEFRYVGMLDGVHSHKPQSVETICKRRFGDCKDKSLLLTSLLRRIGVEAYPALVNTEYRDEIAGWPPSPSAFDHVVTQVAHEGREYWLDATRSYQRGPLEQTYFPAYGRALVVGAGVKGLARIEGDNGLDACKTVINETFRLDDYRGEATLDVTTHYHGRDAEMVRSTFAADSREAIGKAYLSHYAKDYPRIALLSPVELADDVGRNRVTVREAYRIRDFWRPKRGDMEQVEASFHAKSINLEIRSPSTRVRTMPFRVGHPERVDQTIEVHFPTRLHLVEEKEQVDNPAFLFAFECKPVGRALFLKYRYRSRKRQVAAADIGRYLEDVARAARPTGFTIWIPKTHQETLPADYVENTGAAPGADASGGPFRLIGLLALVLSGIGVVFVARWNPPFTREPLADGAPSGIGGWLVLVAIGVVLSPLISLNYVAEVFTTDLSGWSAATTPGSDTYHPLWFTLLVVDVVSQALFFALSILIAYLFFTKKYTLPRVMLTSLALSLVSAVVDLALYNNIPGVEEAVLGQCAKEVVRAGLGAVIWGSYFMVSKRVAATFVRGIPDEQEDVQRREDRHG